jgi:hypothetical protein
MTPYKDASAVAVNGFSFRALRGADDTLVKPFVAARDLVDARMSDSTRR